MNRRRPVEESTVLVVGLAPDRLRSLGEPSRVSVEAPGSSKSRHSRRKLRVNTAMPSTFVVSPTTLAAEEAVALAEEKTRGGKERIASVPDFQKAARIVPVFTPFQTSCRSLTMAIAPARLSARRLPFGGRFSKSSPLVRERM
jgi:hypothetical protein